MNIKEGNKILSLQKDEIDILLRSIIPPFGNFEIRFEIEKITMEMVRSMFDIIKKNANQDMLNVEKGFLENICKAFKVTVDILDPIEYPTLTAFDWIDAMKLYEKMFLVAHASER